MVFSFLFWVIFSTGGIQKADAQLPLADTIFVMDATITDAAQCQCQKNTIKYIAKYTFRQPYNSKFGLIAYADAPILLYRLTWGLNLTLWNQVVDGMTCTGGNSRLDRVFNLAMRMFTSAGRSGSIKTVSVMVSTGPSVSYTEAIQDLIGLGVTVYAACFISTDFSLSNKEDLALAVNHIFTFPNFCSQFLAIRGMYPI